MSFAKVDELGKCSRRARALSVVAACALAVAGWGARAHAETVSWGSNWIQYSGHIDDSLVDPQDDTRLDHSGVDLSQFDSTKGQLTKVTIHANIDLTWNLQVDATESSDQVNFLYGFDIAFDAPSVYTGTNFVQAKLPASSDDYVSASVAAGQIFSVSDEAHPTQTVDIPTINFADFIGNGTVAFNIFRHDDVQNFKYADEESSANASQNYSLNWTGDVSVRYEYHPTAVPLPSAVWGGSILLGIAAFTSWRRRNASV